MNSKETFVIEGLAGERRLKGTIAVRGAKNAALKAMAATVLVDGPVTLENIPDTSDVRTLMEILKKLGAKVADLHGASMTIDSSTINSSDIDVDLAESMRSSIVLTGPLLARFSKVSFPAPGGCVLGARPIDMFIQGYEKMGVQVELKKEIYHIEGNKDSKKVGLIGAEISFHTQSVTATETLMMAAVLAHGVTVLKNCALEPEIVNVAEWLNECGADIRGVGTPTIEIHGRAGKLLPAKKSFVTIPDRIEAGSFLILGALCAEKLSITNCMPDHLGAVIESLREASVLISVKDNSLEVRGGTKPFKAVNIKTHEYPGFPTDLQAPMVTFLTQANGESTVTETIFEGRFRYVEDLIALGANITTMNPREVLIKGPTPFKQLPDSEELRAHDIRAGFAIVLAALIGKGTFTVNNVHLIDRGYERLEERLSELGAKIQRISVN